MSSATDVALMARDLIALSFTADVTLMAPGFGCILIYGGFDIDGPGVDWRTGLKGLNMIAQGNALGLIAIRIIPLVGLGHEMSQTDERGEFVALIPRAIMFEPFRLKNKTSPFHIPDAVPP